MSLAASAALLLTACTTAPTGSTAARPPEVARPATAASPAATARPKPAGVASGQEAARELQATRQGYEEAQLAYARGDRARALEIMNGSYLDHFERVEPWLDQKFGQPYREQVEAAISRDLRRRLRDDPGADLAAQFPLGLKALQEAEAKAATQP